jgi:putative acetyltransferase
MINGAIRDEVPGDVEAIRQVHLEAFGGDIEARIVDLLRARDKMTMSLVTSVGGEVVAHIAFSPVTFAGAPAAFRALGLGPVAVRPKSQARGLGSALIREGIGRCQEGGYDAVVVLGGPKYYARFGFEPAHTFGLENEWGVGDEFMVLTLHDGALQGVRGLVRYAPEFSENG